MRKVSISVKGKAVIAGKAFATEDVAERIEGWLRKDKLEPGDGILISPCASIHTIGMRVAIDAVFLDENLKVCKVVRNLAPNRFAFGALKNLLRSWRSQALELPAGASQGIVAGDILELAERS
jgi:uncharacterized membrane protein (UPF0127 family)